MLMAKENILRDYTVTSQRLGKQETSLHLFGKEQRNESSLR